jgi:EAL domain-containing protein (putative c-di-GMP-specific phosphodiesterase class I)
LSYLHRFPIDTLKVDRSFVSRIANMESSPEKDTQIARTIVMLGHNLGLDVTAEGIETEAQLLILNDLDCKYGQGYFFDKPLSVLAAEELLANNLRSR